MNNKIKFIANVVRLSDKVTSNTYYSVHIMKCSDRSHINVPFQYGHSTAYEKETLKAILDAKWIDEKYKDNLHLYQRENCYPVFYTVKHGNIEECKYNGGK